MNEETERDDFRHGAIAAILVVILLTALAFLSVGCQSRDDDGLKTLHGYEIAHIDTGIDADYASVLLDDGVEQWLVLRGQGHRENALKLRFLIHAGPWFATHQGNAAGSFSAHQARIDLAYGTTPPMAALWHELDHMIGIDHD